MIIYLHGFGSVGSSAKVDRLKEVFGEEKVIAPDLPMDPKEVSRIVFDLVTDFWRSKNPERLVFVGTSLGGFYATYFGLLYDCPAVVVNPSTNPSRSLRDRLGPNKNFSTNEEFMVTIAHLDDLSVMREYIKENYQAALLNVFAAKDDEVVPYESVLEAYPYSAFECVTETGGHRFTEHWELVVNRLKALMDGD